MYSNFNLKRYCYLEKLYRDLRNIKGLRVSVGEREQENMRLWRSAGGSRRRLWNARLRRLDFIHRDLSRREQRTHSQSRAVPAHIRCSINLYLVLNKWDGQVMWSHRSSEAEGCRDVVLYHHVSVVGTGSGEPTLGKCVPAEVGKEDGESIWRKRNAVVSSQTRAAWNGSRTVDLGISL